jgi:hypothetical protein
MRTGLSSDLTWTQPVMTRLRLALNRGENRGPECWQDRFDFLGYTFGSHRYRKVGIRHLGEPIQEERTAAEGQGW